MAFAIAVTPIVVPSCSSGATSQSGHSCGDEAARAKYVSCRSTKTPGACSEAGGTWREAPEKSQSCGPGNKPCKMAQNLPGECDCGTAPDVGCPCTWSGDCADTCLGAGNDKDECAAQAEGKCGQRKRIGCACRFEAKGTPSFICH